MNRPLRILLDVDGVIADIVGDICRELREHGFDRTPEHFVHYEFRDVLTAKENAIAQAAMARPGFCARMTPYPGQRGFVESLKRRGEVVAVTKPFPNGPTWAYERMYWLRHENIPVISTAHKAFIPGDWLIEDSIGNARAWSSAHPSSRVLIMDRPWNRGDHPGWRAGDFLDALDILDRNSP